MRNSREARTSNLLWNNWGENDWAVTRLHLDGADAGAGAGAGRGTDAMWLTGHTFGPPQPPALILIGDTIPGDTSTTATLTVNAPHTIGTTETIGDQDFYKVTLTAGQDYEVGMYAKVGGPSGIAQADCYIEIYDSAGHLITSADGGAHTLYNNGNSGFDVLTTFTPETSGTYYINARAFDQDPTNGTDGDTVGDYELFVQTASPFAYHAYYDLDSPLHSIDWGTQVDGTSRNPDGDEGPRVTGNPETGYAYNPYGIEGKNVITYYFARQGEIFIDEDPTTPGTTDTIVASGFEDWEKGVYLNAFGAYSNVADIVYVEVASRSEADFTLITYEGTPGPGVSLLGRMSPPDEENEGRTEFNANDERWTEEGLAPGGFSFTTLIHELGHGHGLAHPHDNGGHSSIMRGVEPEGVAFDYTNGEFDLNQSIYTMMSYEDGWQKSPYGQADTTDGFGWLGSLMAFDVAAIQDKYGVNEDYHIGNDTYTLKDANEAGTYYSCIWDAGGNDTIVYGGARNANIDLRAATLQYEYGGGGWVSYAFGIYGGFTIANGVTVENAVGGSGNDILIGNGAANSLVGNAGNDGLTGGAGTDGLFGGDGVDSLSGGADNDYLDGGTGNDALMADAGDDIALGGAGVDGLFGGAGGDQLDGGADNDYLDGGLDNDTLLGGGGNDIVLGGDGMDGLFGDIGDDTLQGNAHGDYLDGGAGNDSLEGGTGNDVLFGRDGLDGVFGGDGNDNMDGGLGADYLVGAAGNDLFVFSTAFSGSNIDIIADFQTGADRIALSQALVPGMGLGGLAAGAFVVGPNALDADDRIIYNQTTGALLFDADGVGGVAAVQFATIASSPPLQASDFTVI